MLLGVYPKVQNGIAMVYLYLSILFIYIYVFMCLCFPKLLPITAKCHESYKIHCPCDRYN